MHGLPLGIVEECIIADPGTQRSSVYEIRMKHQSDHIGSELRFFIFHTYDLARRETHHRAFLIVVRLTPVSQDAVGVIFEIKRIDTIIHQHMIDGARGLFKIQHRHKRVTGLESVKFVIGVYGIKYDCRGIRFHAAKITFFPFISISSGNHGMAAGNPGNPALPWRPVWIISFYL